MTKESINKAIRDREIKKFGGTFNGLAFITKQETHMIKPLNNTCLIEIIDEFDGVIGSDKNENVQKGVLRDYNLTPEHLTASTGYTIETNFTGLFEKLTGKTVYWQEYADAGSKFDIDGKQYALVPFYRLIGVEE